MVTIREAMEEINKIEQNNRLEYARHKYGEYLNEDIIKYYLEHHCNQYYDMTEFDNIDILNCEIIKSSVSSKEVFDKVSYADFCSFRIEDKNVYEGLKDNAYLYWKNGTWSAPILVTPKNNKLIALDGNNRLRMLRSYLKYSDQYKSDRHLIYIIKNKGNKQ